MIIGEKEKMGIEDVIIIAILVLIVAGVSLYIYIYREKKRGSKCIGCPHSKNCSGGCNKK